MRLEIIKKIMTYQRIIKHGNSLAVVIPAQIARDLGFKRGDYLEMWVGKHVKGQKYIGSNFITLWKPKSLKSQ